MSNKGNLCLKGKLKEVLSFYAKGFMNTFLL